MTREIKRPQLTDIEKLPLFFQDLYEKWNYEKGHDLTPRQVTDIIAELKLASEMADYSLARNIPIGHVFNQVSKCPDLFPSAAFVSPRGRATAYFKAVNYINAVAAKPVQPVRKVPVHVALILAKAAGFFRE